MVSRIRMSVVSLLIVVMMLFGTASTFARGGGGFSGGGGRSFSSGGSRSFGSGGSSSSRSFSGGSSSRSTTFGTSSGRSFSSTPRTVVSKPGNFNGRPVTSTRLSKADAALVSKAKTNGTLYSSRATATKSFQTKYAGQYTNKFSSQPKTRPSYIPNTYTTGGRSYNVTYNQQYGGYGYMNGGRWMMYDAMTDAIMLNALMNQHNYVVYQPAVTQQVYDNDHSAALTVFWIIFWIIIVILVIYFLTRD